MTNKHTPINWRIAPPVEKLGGILSKDRYVQQYDPDGIFPPMTVAIVYGSTQENKEANTHLIEAAPEMLRALEDYFESPHAPSSAEWEKTTKELIKKAKGES